MASSLPKTVIFLVFTFLVSNSNALDNGLALTPPMGWLSWTVFTCQIDCKKYPDACINEKLYTDMADRLVADGYLEAGYNFVNIDDCWMSYERDEQGRLQANKTRFPRGIPYLSDYMHQKGLKLGIYEDYGNKTCGGYPGSLQYLQTDAITFAEWKVDMLKLDGCYSDIRDMPAGYPLMGYYVNQTGRPIIYSCSWPAYEVGEGVEPNYQKIGQACNLWRNYDDIWLGWPSVQGIINWYDHNQEAMAAVQGPGKWNDPDMIIVGTEKLTVDQSQAQMAIWSIWSAPLLMSNDLRNIKKEYKEILLNSKVIAVDQDPLGIMGQLKINSTNVGIYLKPMTPVDKKTGDHSYAIVIFNRNLKEKAYVTLKAFKNLGLTHKAGYFAENLFTGEKPGVLYPYDGFNATVNPTGVVMLKLTVRDTTEYFVRD